MSEQDQEYDCSSVRVHLQLLWFLMVEGQFMLPRAALERVLMSYIH